MDSDHKKLSHGSFEPSDNELEKADGGLSLQSTARAIGWVTSGIAACLGIDKITDDTPEKVKNHLLDAGNQKP